MTAKHFQAIAENLNKALHSDPNSHNAIVLLARNLSNEFEGFNPLFNRSKFLSVALA